MACILADTNDTISIEAEYVCKNGSFAPGSTSKRYNSHATYVSSERTQLGTREYEYLSEILEIYNA